MGKIKLKEVSFYRLDRPLDQEGGALDMLRYDVAFVRDQDPTLLAFPVFSTKTGALGTGPTLGRWNSFLLYPKVLGKWTNRTGVVWSNPTRQLVPTTLMDAAMGFLSPSPVGWTTYRHPKDSDGAENYGRLMPMTLAQVLEQGGRS